MPAVWKAFFKPVTPLTPSRPHKLSISARLRQQYARLKAAYIKEAGLVCPPEYRSQFVSWGGAVEVQYIYGKFAEAIPQGGTVLVIGAMGGRDYWYLRN